MITYCFVVFVPFDFATTYDNISSLIDNQRRDNIPMTLDDETEENFEGLKIQFNFAFIYFDKFILIF